MRFLFYDRVTRLEKGKTIVGVTVFSLSAEYHRGHFSKLALVPGTILIEAMAQLLGWLINYSHDFHVGAILSIIEGARVESRHRPGFQACITGELLTTSSTDSVGKSWIEVEGKCIASIDRLMYSHFLNVNSAELRDRFCYFSGLSDDDLEPAKHR